MKNVLEGGDVVATTSSSSVTSKENGLSSTPELLPVKKSIPIYYENNLYFSLLAEAEMCGRLPTAKHNSTSLPANPQRNNQQH